VSWFSKPAVTERASTADAESFAAVRRELATALHEVGLLRREVADLDDKFRRWRSRDAKRAAVDEADEPANGALTVAQLRAQGRFPWK